MTRLMSIPMERIRVNAQVRKNFDEASIRGLAESIEHMGLQHPLLCREDGEFFVIIDGERRHRALTFLRRTEALALVLAAESGSPGQDLARQLICNLQREDLDPLERAVGIHAFMEQGKYGVDDAGKRLGLSAAAVTRSLSILRLPEDLRNKIRSGEISADSGYQLSRVEDPRQQAVLAGEVMGKRLTRDALARKLKRVRQADTTRSNGPTRVTTMLGEGRSVTLVGKGLSLDSVIDWLEQLLAKAKRAKAQALSLETFARAMKDQASKGATP